MKRSEDAKQRQRGLRRSISRALEPSIFLLEIIPLVRKESSSAWCSAANCAAAPSFNCVYPRKSSPDERIHRVLVHPRCTAAMALHFRSPPSIRPLQCCYPLLHVPVLFVPPPPCTRGDESTTVIASRRRAVLERAANDRQTRADCESSDICRHGAQTFRTRYVEGVLQPIVPPPRSSFNCPPDDEYFRDIGLVKKSLLVIFLYYLWEGKI